MRATIEGKFIQAERAGRYVRGELIAGGVQRFYHDMEKHPEAERVADTIMGLSELDEISIVADVFANTPKGGGTPYLSVKVLEIAKKGARRAAPVAG